MMCTWALMFLEEKLMVVVNGMYVDVQTPALLANLLPNFLIL